MQGSNPHLLHWQADSLPLRHQGSPYVCIYMYTYKHTYIYTLIFGLPSHLGHRALNGASQVALTLNRVPVLYSRFSLVICFIHTHAYMSIPFSHCIPPPFPSLVSIHPFSMTLSLFLLCSMTCFELTFVCGMKFRSRFIYLPTNVQLFQHHLLKILSFLYWIFFQFLSKFIWAYLCGPILGFSILLH